MSEPFLIGDAMTGGYGKGPDILHECTIAVNPGEIAVIVGPNGAGKSTAMKAVFGMLNVHSGRVVLDGLCAANLEHLHVDDCRREPRNGRIHPARRFPRYDGANL